jgi:hypothetical protein
MKNTNKYLILTALVSSAIVFNGCVVNTGNPNAQNPYPPAQGGYTNYNNAANTGPAAAGLQDLVGARAAGGDSELQRRGFSNVKSENGGDSSYTSWRRGNQCVWVRTNNGHYVSIADATMADCGGGGQSYTGNAGGYSPPALFKDLVGTSSFSAIGRMSERGFTSVDTIISGNTQYNIFYNRNTQQCIQMTFADFKVYSADDIKTHPKCR